MRYQEMHTGGRQEIIILQVMALSESQNIITIIIMVDYTKPH